MRKLTLLIIFLSVFAFVPGYILAEEVSDAIVHQETVDFTGEWDWIQADVGYSFYIRLKQSGNQITGSYCATALFGQRVDCGFDEGQCSIKGIVHGDTARVEFTSCYGGKSGKARIIRHADTITWIIDEIPHGRWYFCPRKAILERHLKIWKITPEI